MLCSICEGSTAVVVKEKDGSLSKRACPECCVALAEAVAKDIKKRIVRPVRREEL